MRGRNFKESRSLGRNARRGFTLAELMLAMTLASLVIAGATFTINMWARSSMSLGNYADMSGSCRRALDIFASDVRMANNVSVSTSTSFTFTAYDASNTIVTVSYIYDPDTDELRRTYDGTSMVLLSDVDRFGLSYYDLNRNSTTNALSVKEVQIEAILLKNVLTIANTDEIISARFMLRNRRVSS